MPKTTEIIYIKSAPEWRKWLEQNYKKEKDIWLKLPHNDTGEPKIPYNDSVEEALCFGWIDSTVKNVDANNSIQRFTPRRKGSTYSQTNKERLRLLVKQNKLMPEVLEAVKDILNEKFIFPEDILKAIKANKDAWENYQKLSDSYKRIRISFIEDSRNDPKVYEARLNSFIKKTAQNKNIGYGLEKFI